MHANKYLNFVPLVRKARGEQFTQAIYYKRGQLSKSNIINEYVES